MQGFDGNQSSVDEARRRRRVASASMSKAFSGQFRCQNGGMPASHREIVANPGRIEGKFNESRAPCLDSVIYG
ncbi:MULTISPECIES: hypothetical protein [unclassified Sphingopyxis]|uniref:hypothetical protein n=1 Tax=unclassified Sphingopyxis TaxID=2614943 RepID=UPI000AFED78D|nr:MULTISPECIES: hypothetical protein [unclassified Sphingopyxis]